MVNVNLTRIVDALCAWVTSDLIGRALSRAAGFCRWRFQRDARCHWRRHGICYETDVVQFVLWLATRRTRSGNSHGGAPVEIPENKNVNVS